MNIIGMITVGTIFSILIVIHEFGHYIAAKRSGVKVERFALGFGPVLFRKKGKETEFVVCAFPLGGYVKMAGDTRQEHKGLNNEFLSKSVGVKSKIVFAGPLFNYILALVIFCIIALIGFPYPDSVVGSVLDDYPAKAAGVEEGDRILAVNGNEIEHWMDMAEEIYQAKDTVNLRIEREGKIISLAIPLQQKEITDDFGKRKNVSMIGIGASSEIKTVKYNFPQAIIKGFESLFKLTFLVVKGFLFMILGVIPFKEAVAGPVGIYYITSEVIKIGIVPTLHLLAALSISLAIINLFPIPVLDGGHLLFFFMEKVRGKPISEKVEDNLTRVGLSLLILLIVFVFYNDIVRFGPKILNKKKAVQIEEKSSIDGNEKLIKE
ncbi:MAG: RIP metalloprotease RseP [Candidatus Omnitrophica bacterium]|nr:RIP metalloprotease RseP [Candidatus Omnitrophota bacterium]